MDLLPLLLLLLVLELVVVPLPHLPRRKNRQPLLSRPVQAQQQPEHDRYMYGAPKRGATRTQQAPLLKATNDKTNVSAATE